MNKLPPYALLTAVIVLLGHALTMPVAQQKGGFFSDEATYYAMAYSIAFDGDIRYEAHDLERVYDRGHEGGPSGIFLRRQELTGHLYYAKAFAYSLAAAPFVRLFGDNGFFLLNALLLGGVMLAGYTYLARALAPRIAAACALAYFLASIVGLYYFWITPEIFNLSIGFFATFLWLFKERPPGWPEDAPWKPSGWLAGGWTDVAAALLYGVAAYSKPPNVILLAPLLLWMLLQRRFQRAVVLGLVAAAVIVGMFAVTDVTTGDWNYMGGDRRSFTGPYPLQYRERPFETIGNSMITEVSGISRPLPPPRPPRRRSACLRLGGSQRRPAHLHAAAVLAMLAYARVGPAKVAEPVFLADRGNGGQWARLHDRDPGRTGSAAAAPSDRATSWACTTPRSSSSRPGSDFCCRPCPGPCGRSFSRRSS